MKVAVTSPSFSKHPDLIAKMSKEFPDAKLNAAGEKFSRSSLIDYLKGYDAAIIGLDEIDDDILAQLPEIKIIAKYRVGLNNIDVEACKKRGVKIGWTGGVNKTSVAEMVIANMLILLRNIYQTSNLLKEGKWEKDGGEQLTNKTVGIIGVGHIGKEVVQMLAPFNCTILVNDVVNQDNYYKQNNLTESTKENIFKQADIITIHTPLTNETKNLLNQASFSLMKPNAVIINTARGGIIQENDLYNALVSKVIKAAALDVYEEEPPVNTKLLALPNLICTPHIGGNAKEAVYAMGMSAINHLIEYKLINL